MHGRHILVVEDHALMREVIHGALTHAFPEMPVTAVADGARAIALADQLPPAIVVVDGHLPDMSGLQVARRIKTAHPETRVVVFSMAEGAAEQREATEAGVDAYVKKDAGMSALIAALKELL